MLPPPILIDRDDEDVSLLPTYKPWVKLSPKAMIEWLKISYLIVVDDDDNLMMMMLKML